MAISRASDSSIQDGLPKYNDIWDGTTATSAFDTLGAVVLGSEVTSITFSNIPQTYTHLQIRMSASATGPSGAAIYGGWIRFNGDSGSNYSFHGIYGDGSTVTGFAGANQTHAASLNYATADATSVQAAVVLDILDYANTNKFKTVRSLVGGDFNTGGNITLYSGNWRSSTAISSINLSINTGFGSFNFSTGTTFALYGIK